MERKGNGVGEDSKYLVGFPLPLVVGDNIYLSDLSSK
jgi:hypothetical protein